MKNTGIYEDIAKRTNGDIYVGVVGPVRCGKSTFIKKFMDTLVIPNITDENERKRATDELPQSAGGRTIMTTEPKFIPENSVRVDIGNAHLNVKMVDCVGYMAKGAEGNMEDGHARMVSTPWDAEPVPFEEAAEKGTRKVISEHSTVAVLVTCDGTFGDLPRDSFIPAEERIVNELTGLSKPFVIILNSAVPEDEKSLSLAMSLEEKYKAPVALVNCTELDRADIEQIINMLTFEFPLRELTFEMPDWTGTLPEDHWLRGALLTTVKSVAESTSKLSEVSYIGGSEVSSPMGDVHVGAVAARVDLGEGTAYVKLTLEEGLFYRMIEELCDITVTNKGELLSKLCEMAETEAEYEKYREAIDEVERCGYGIVMPTVSELELEAPEVVKQQGAYGVRLHAGAPSIHLIKTRIETDINPMIGTEKQSEELVSYLLSELENDASKVWDSNMFGRSLYELVSDGLRAKLTNIPNDARGKIGDTLSRIINEGSTGLVCIIL
ncbi:MAG: stage IV sporulation protein A [Ruminococcaceae bacterium]|nr:stage IV sporulation protein A [Oscillospiraceae bacterium]